MSGWQDLPFAQQVRDIIRELAEKEIHKLRPSGSLAFVDSIDTATNTCMVIFPGDVDPVKVRMNTIQPTVGGGTNVGDVVRVDGESARRYVSEVVNGLPFIRAGQMALATLQTTASSANMFVDAVTGVVFRSTSSRRYKKNIYTAETSDATVELLRPVVHENINDESGKKFLGLIAEELEELDSETLSLLVVQDENGEPDAINYDRLAVFLIPTIQRLLKRVEDLESRLG